MRRLGTTCAMEMVAQKYLNDGLVLRSDSTENS